MPGIGLSRGLHAIDFVPTNAAGGILDSTTLAGTADTGDVISADAALNVSAFWRGMNLISTGQAMLPLFLYRRVGEHGKTKAKDHSLYPVLHDQANEEMSSFTWRQTIAAHVVAWGNGYSEKVFDGTGKLRELWPLRPDRMIVERERLSAQQVAAGARPRRRYRYRLASGEQVLLPSEKIHHVRGLAYDGLVGYPVLTLMRNTLALTRASERAQGAMFKNSARPSVALSHKGVISPQARKDLAEDWREAYSGIDNIGRVAVLEEGISVETFGIPPADAQWLQTRQFQVLEFCRWLGVAPHKLYELSRATFSNIEQQALEYLSDSLNGWLVNWEQQMLLDLLTKPERTELFPEFERNAFMQVDARSRAAFYQTMRWLGVMNGDDIAGKENLNPLPDGLGQTYYVPMNMEPLQAGGPPPRRGQPGPAGAYDPFPDMTATDLEDRVAALEITVHRNGSEP